MKELLKSIVSEREDRQTWYCSQLIGNNKSFYLEELKPVTPPLRQELDKNYSSTLMTFDQLIRSRLLFLHKWIDEQNSCYYHSFHVSSLLKKSIQNI